MDRPAIDNDIQALIADILSVLHGQTPSLSSLRNPALLTVYHRTPSPDSKANQAMERLLLEHGANPDARDDSGQTLLHYAAHHNDAEIVMLLLDHGAKVDSRSGGGRTPLFRASLECSRILIDHGANANALADDGTTPLMIAYMHQVVHISVVPVAIITSMANIVVELNSTSGERIHFDRVN